MAKQQEQRVGGQEGSRWINRKPDGDELARWFKENVPVDEGLDHARYLPGIVLIESTEYVKRVFVDESGQEQIADKDVKRIVYTPYPKVETRELYFWDWCDLHGYLGEITLIPNSAEPNRHLPDGFFHMPVTGADGRESHPFVGVTYQVRIWRDHQQRRPVRIPPPGTKVVPLLKRGYNGVIRPDEDAIAKAQTGAIGRALGYAGMLIVPGAGIATAEDMVEFLAAGGEVPAAPAPAPAPDGATAATATDLRELVAEHVARLESDFPNAYEEVAAWAAEKSYDLVNPPEAALRGLERQLRRKLGEAAKVLAEATG